MTELLDLPPVPDQLGFDEEHELARRAARSFLAERCPIAEVRRLSSDAIGHDPALHRESAELGWLELGASDGLHLALLIEEMGRVLWPAPFFACILALRALERGASGAQLERWRTPIASGAMVATLAHTEPGGAWRPEHIQARAEPSGAGFVLRGTKTHVLAGASADLVVVPCREPDGGLALFALELPTRGATLEPEVCVDTTRRTARLELDSVSVGREARLDGDAQAALASAFGHGATLLACEMVGSAEAVLERTRAYAIERQQFGRAVGSFQAVKHPIVDVMIGVELGRSLALGAATLLDKPGAASETAAHMAKAFAGDRLSEAVKKGVQLHGGFGFTWDCDVHFYFKRALWARSTLGDSIEHRRALGELLLG